MAFLAMYGWRSWRSCGQDTNIREKRMNDAITIGMAATAVGTVLWFLVK